MPILPARKPLKKTARVTTKPRELTIYVLTFSFPPFDLVVHISFQTPSPESTRRLAEARQAEKNQHRQQDDQQISDHDVLPGWPGCCSPNVSRSAAFSARTAFRFHRHLHWLLISSTTCLV